MGTFLLCLTAIIITAIICDCVKECRRIDNYTDYLERANKELQKAKEKRF